MHFDLQEEVQSLQDGTYAIENELSVKNARPGQVDTALDGAIDAIAGSSESVNDSRVFDTFRSLLKHANHLEPVQLSKVLDALTTAFQSEIDATARDGVDLSDPSAYRSHRTTLEIYAFLLMWFVQAAERYITTARAGDDSEQTAGKKKGGKGKNAKASKGKGDFAWADQIQSVLLLFSKALRLKTERIWQTTQERDSFIGCFIKPTNRLAESEAYMKSNDIRMAIYKVFCLAAKNHGQAFGIQVLIMQNLTAYEHLPEPMAELVTILVKEFDYAHLGEELLREIASKNFPGGADTKAQRPFPRFLVKLSELCPRLVHKQMVVLQKHLDSESYPMRNAIIEVLGNLIREITNSEEEGEPGQQKRELESFFGLLFDRFLDINAFVRSKVVQVFLKILEIHTNRFADARLRLTALAVRSIEDKTSTVRKNCIALLVKLILTHPYGALHGGELDLTKFEEGYKRVCDELAPMEAPSQEVLDAMANDNLVDENGDKENQQGDQSAGDATIRVKAELRDDEEALDSDEVSSDEDESRDERRAKAAAAKAAQKQRRQSNGAPRKSDVAIGAAFARLDQDKLAKLRLTKRYYSDALTFITELEKAVPLIETLLASKVKSEVLEAMEFFKVAYEYKLESAESGVKRMLHLVWSKDNSTVEDGQEIRSIRSRLIECYRSLYFDPLRELAPVENVNRITKNMISLTFGATLAELTSLEQLMITLMNDDAVHEDITAKLWQVYSTSKDIPKHQRRGAILVLGMLAAAKPEMISEHIDLLLKIGLGPHGKADFVLAKYSCIALRRLGGNQKKVKGALSDTTVRLPMDNPVFERLKDIVEKTTVDLEWFSMAEQAINTIYVLGEQPDALAASIIQDLTKRLFGDASNTSDASVANKSATPEASQTQAASENILDAIGDATDVAEKEETATSERLGSATASPAPAGPQMADAFQLAQLLYTAGHVSVRQILHLELAEREFKRRKAELEQKDNAKAVGNEELDQVVGSVEDDIADLVMHAKEKELLYSPDALLSIYGPMAVAVCSQPKVYKNNTLRIAAVSTMCKFMCVSAQFCEDHLMLLFKLLETSMNPIIRSNIVIALGDIAVCFSTLMDQNSDRLYAGLTDRDMTVKKNTLMVLTHLILNGMIKVKGQLGEMAKCLEDDDNRISDLAKLFFEELSTKENAIYNNLPDIISHLSVGTHAVDEETYQKIMKYIFRYIEKEKQAESIVDKLCQRFRVVTDERQWRDIAFCMSMLPFKSERSVKKLVDGLPFYQDKLKEDVVYRLFTEILNKARSNKAVKNENELLEFERALEEHKRLGQENAAIEQKAHRKTKRKAAAPPRARKGRVQQQSATPPSSPER